MDARTLLTTFATTVGAVLFGKPIVATATASAGAALEVGKIVLTIVKRRHAFQRLKRDHELAYIIEASERLERK